MEVQATAMLRRNPDTSLGNSIVAPTTEWKFRQQRCCGEIRAEVWGAALLRQQLNGSSGNSDVAAKSGHEFGEQHCCANN